jgi:hypothetical protein
MLMGRPAKKSSRSSGKRWPIRTVPTTPNTEIGEYLGRWLDDPVKESVRAGTYERYESVYRVHIIPYIGKKLTGLTEMNVQSLYRERLDAGCSARTVQYRYWRARR